ncbi:MAG: response regulator, partial [Bacteroidota bacterium]|nr:response regulator [Bacteroidota bacterium]
IFMDLWIPTIGGEKAVMLLKENTATKNIPVILFSANGEIKQISHRIKADGYLEKPFGISRFREIIKTSARK